MGISSYTERTVKIHRKHKYTSLLKNIADKSAMPLKTNYTVLLSTCLVLFAANEIDGVAGDVLQETIVQPRSTGDGLQETIVHPRSSLRKANEISEDALPNMNAEENERSNRVSRSPWFGLLNLYNLQGSLSFDACAKSSYYGCYDGTCWSYCVNNMPGWPWCYTSVKIKDKYYYASCKKD